MDIVLGDGGEEPPKAWNLPSNKPINDVIAFLKEYLAVKIVIIIDTHCLNNGAFIYQGNSLMTYVACYLPKASIHYKSPCCHCS